jgi:hypothetical protein
LLVIVSKTAMLLSLNSPIYAFGIPNALTGVVGVLVCAEGVAGTLLAGVVAAATPDETTGALAGAGTSVALLVPPHAISAVSAAVEHPIAPALISNARRESRANMTGGVPSIAP